MDYWDLQLARQGIKYAKKKISLKFQFKFNHLALVCGRNWCWRQPLTTFFHSNICVFDYFTLLLYCHYCYLGIYDTYSMQSMQCLFLRYGWGGGGLSYCLKLGLLKKHKQSHYKKHRNNRLLSNKAYVKKKEEYRYIWERQGMWHALNWVSVILFPFVRVSMYCLARLFVCFISFYSTYLLLGLLMVDFFYFSIYRFIYSFIVFFFFWFKIEYKKCLNNA